MYRFVEFEIRERIAVITLNNREKLNALSFDMIDELHLVLDEIEGDADIRVALIWGGQEKFFCAGGDVENLSRSSVIDAYEISRKSHRLYSRIEGLPIPTVAAVGGLALGGGFEISLACDFRVINEKAKFGLTEICLGLIPGGGGTVRLTKLLGKSRAQELMFLGDVMTADRAVELGVANRKVPVGELYEAAFAFAKRLAEQAPLSIRAIKRLAGGGEGAPPETAYEREAGEFSRLFGTKDAKEGMAAFLGKRPPVYTGE